MLAAGSHGRLAAVSHPSLGRPPLDLSAGHPADAAALRAGTERVAGRALEAAVAADPTFRDRYDELRLRELLADLHAFVARLATAISADDARVMSGWAEQVAVRYRKRAVPMDDVITLCEGLRSSARAFVEPGALDSIDASLDAAIKVFRWHRRLAGDARKRHPLLAFLYKGA
jgi:hypothetical protein